jgi:uncharacterized membrane protein
MDNEHSHAEHHHAPGHTHESAHHATHVAHKNMPMAILSYIGPLVIVSYLTAKDDPFVKFHIKQGLVLFIIEIAVWVLSGMFWPLWMLFRLVNLGTFILSVVGIVNVTQGKEKELPLVGGWSKYFKI